MQILSDSLKTTDESIQGKSVQGNASSSGSLGKLAGQAGPEAAGKEEEKSSLKEEGSLAKGSAKATITAEPGMEEQSNHLARDIQEMKDVQVLRAWERKEAEVLREALEDVKKIADSKATENEGMEPLKINEEDVKVADRHPSMDACDAIDV